METDFPRVKGSEGIGALPDGLIYLDQFGHRWLKRRFDRGRVLFERVPYPGDDFTELRKSPHQLATERVEIVDVMIRRQDLADLQGAVMRLRETLNRKMSTVGNGGECSFWGQLPADLCIEINAMLSRAGSHPTCTEPEEEDDEG